MLDILTPRGQANEVHTERCFSQIVKFFSQVQPVTLERTPDDHPADGILRDAGGKPLLLIEVKSRKDFTEDQFWSGRHDGKWLITAHKIDRNIPVARELGCAFIGALHIVQSRVILLKKIWHNGVTASGIVKRHCFTQATINGGTAYKLNAFIPMHDARRIDF